MSNDALLSAFVETYFTTIKNFNDLISAPMAKYKLSFEQYQILHDVAENEAISLTDIVNKRHVTKPAIARQIRVLRDLDYLHQEQSNLDRRRFLLHLTPLGVRVEHQVTEAARMQFNRWLTVLGHDKAEQLLSLLNEVGEKLINTDTDSTQA